MSLKAVKKMQTITSEQKNENLSDISYKIKMGTFDEKMGPLCLNAKKGDRCEIRKGLCPGFKCQLIEDAINSKENHLIFRLQDQFVQGIKLKAENPAKRGGIERFILLIKLIQNQG